jgi:hypothetical protein
MPNLDSYERSSRETVQQRERYRVGEMIQRSQAGRDLQTRGFVGPDKHASPRCWCGRPQSDATQQCNQGHAWPHV